MMKPLTVLSGAALLAALTIAATPASAGRIVGASTGLVAPAVQITFDAPQATLDQDARVGDQYADLGATFDYLYYSPGDDEGPYASVNGNYLGNFVTDGDAEVSRLTIAFTNQQTSAAFGLASNGGEGGNGNIFTFEAFLGDLLVDSFSASVRDGYYGFSESGFDRIVVTSTVPAFARESFAEAQAFVQPDFYLFDNLQFGTGAVVAAVPEPDVIALLGLGLLGGLSKTRRTSRSQADQRSRSSR